MKKNVKNQFLEKLQLQKTLIALIMTTSVILFAMAQVIHQLRTS
jgi:DNA-binding MltR family transcriptional regulator